MNRFSKTICRSFGTLRVSPTLSHVLESVDITGDGFEASIPLTVQNCLVCPEEGFDFQSYVHIYTNTEGCFDLKATKSIGGTYTGVERMGLFWSMVTRSRLQRTFFANGLQNLSYNFNVFDGHISEFDHDPVSTASCSRYLTRNVTRSLIVEDGLRGTLFVPEGNGPFPCLVTLYGGIKKDRVPEQMAAFLSSQGFATLALAYFGVEGIQKTYTESPLRIEYFETALMYLRGRGDIDESRIGVIGESKGGDITLAMISHLLGIKAACTVNGSISSIATPTTYKGKTTDQIGMTLERIKFLDSTTANAVDCVNNPLDEPSSIHQFEHSNADLLIIAGMKDLNWKSGFLADIAKERMDKVGKTNYEIVKLPEFGHLLEIPYMPLCLKTGHPLVPKGLMLSFGGDCSSEHSKQQYEAWERIIKFFKEKLGYPKSRL